MRALFLSTNTPLAAGVRYRALQYFPRLAEQGIHCEHRSLFDERLDEIIYRPGRTGEKVGRLALATARRLADVLGATRYDVVVVLREAYLVGPPVLEALLRALGRPLVFDVDDAVWEGYDSPTYGRLARFLKCSWKTAPTVRMAAAVTAGNSYVAAQMRRWNDRVTLLPTVVDTDLYRPAERPPSPLPVLGWIGSHSTFQYLRPLLPVLARLSRQAAFRLRLVGAAADVPPQPFPLENVAWSREREVADVQSFDIGLFPVVEDAWSRGKSGFKAVQYGACGIPTVATPVTTNREIVLHQETGLLASSEEEWLSALRQLLGEPALRARLGGAARRRIGAHYSLAVHAPRLAEVLARAAG